MSKIMHNWSFLILKWACAAMAELKTAYSTFTQLSIFLVASLQVQRHCEAYPEKQGVATDLKVADNLDRKTGV